MNIIINDKLGNKIGKLPNATTDEINRYLDKGFEVIDVITGEKVTKETLCDSFGVSDGFIQI